MPLIEVRSDAVDDDKPNGAARNKRFAAIFWFSAVSEAISAVRAVFEALSAWIWAVELCAAD